MLRPQITIKYWLAIVLVIIYSVYKLKDFPVHDFTNLYFAGLFFAHGQFDESSYDAYYFNVQISSLGYENVFTGFYPNTPFIVLLFAIFSLLPLTIAKYVFVFFSLILFLASLNRLFISFNIPRNYLLIIPVLFFTPIKNNILFGQAYFLLFFLLSEGIILFKKEKYFLSGLVWSIGILLKIIPLFIILFLILNRHWRTLLYMFVLGLISFVSILILFGYPFLEFYIREVLIRSTSGDLFGGFSPAAQSATMLFKNIFVADELTNPSPICDSIYGYHIIQIIYKVFVLLTCTVIAIHEKAPAALKFSIWLFAGLLFSPTLSTYAPIILIIPLLSILSKMDEFPKVFILIILLLTLVFCNFPVHWFPSSLFLIYFVRLGLLVLILGILGYLYGSTMKPKIIIKSSLVWLCVLISISLPLLIKDLNDEKATDSYLILKESRLLITNYEIEDGELHYLYWSRNGEQKQNTGIQITSLDTANVSVIDNQVFYRDNQLTYSNDLKRLPKIADNQWIIYLSDKNRGMGFYTLRKIPM